MSHWRKPSHTIETELGTVYSVEDDEMETTTEHFHSADDPMKFKLKRESSIPDWAYIIGVTIIASTVLGLIGFIFRG